MSRGPINLQDAFLNQMRKESVPVTIHLISGVELQGEVKGFDNFTIVLSREGAESLIYKHAVASLVPRREASLFRRADAEPPLAADSV